MIFVRHMEIATPTGHQTHIFIPHHMRSKNIVHIIQLHQNWLWCWFLLTCSSSPWLWLTLNIKNWFGHRSKIHDDDFVCAYLCCTFWRWFMRIFLYESCTPHLVNFSALRTMQYVWNKCELIVWCMVWRNESKKIKRLRVRFGTNITKWDPPHSATN